MQDIGMRIIPVLDILNGIVVRAVAGRRSEYRPLVSKLTASVEPTEVARALLAATGAQELYVADLDAISGTGVTTLDPAAFGATVLLDAGLRRMEQLAGFERWPKVRPVVGTETWTVPPRGWPKPFPAILSLDFFDGHLRRGWAEDQGLETIAECVVPTVIFLDIARVGTGRGAGMEGLITGIRRYFPEFELIAGGGVKNWDDIKRLEDAGADAVLVASALHDGSLLRFH